jgi:hypothetical protein
MSNVLGSLEPGEVVEGIPQGLERLYPEGLSKSLWFFDGNAPAGRKVHDVTVVAASHEERAARGIEPHLLPVRLETFHDHSRAGEGCMSAQGNLNRRSEPPDAETPPPQGR